MDIHIPKCKICKLYVQLGEIILYVRCEGGQFCHKKCNDKRECFQRCFVCLGVCVPLELKIYDSYGATYYENQLKSTREDLKKNQTQLAKLRSEYIKLERKHYTLEDSNRRIEDRCSNFERKYIEAKEIKRRLDQSLKELRIQDQQKDKVLKALADRVEELQKEVENKTKMS